MKLRGTQIIILLCITYSFAFSQRTVGLLEYAENISDGYVLFTPITSRNTYLIDNCGYRVHSWSSTYVPGQVAYLMEDGNLLRTARIPGNFTGGGIGGRVEILDWNSNILWSYNFASDSTHQHHTVQPMPNGNLLVVMWKKYSRVAAINHGFDPSKLTSEGIWSDKIIEIEPIGSDSLSIIWEWDFWDHTIQDFDPSKNNFGIIQDHPELLDVNFFEDPGANRAEWIHLNAIDYNPELDQIVVSSKYHNEFYIIDHSTTIAESKTNTGGKYGKGGDFLFRWGNPRSYGLGTVDNHWLYGQHDVQWIDKGLDGEGNVLLFNNGSNRLSEPYSSVEEIVTEFDSLGQYLKNGNGVYLPELPSWYYQGSPKNSFFSSRISSAQRLWNGNTLICEGNKGNFIEVTPQNDIVWQYICPVNGQGGILQGSKANNNDVFKITKYQTDFSGLEGKDLSPSTPLETGAIEYDCLLLSNTISEGNTQMPKPYKIINNEIIIHSNYPISRYAIFDILGNQMKSGKSNDIIILDGFKAGLYVISFEINETGTFHSYYFLKI